MITRINGVDEALSRLTRRGSNEPATLPAHFAARIEEVFGRAKSIGGQARGRFRGLPRVGIAFTLTAVAYNLVRLPKLLPKPA